MQFDINPLKCKGRFWLEPVKGKMHSPATLIHSFAALDRTYPKSESAFARDMSRSVQSTNITLIFRSYNYIRTMYHSCIAQVVLLYSCGRFKNSCIAPAVLE